MSQQLAIDFFPVIMGDLVKHHAPQVFYSLLPDWVAERCPMPSVDLQVPGFGYVTLFWPVAALFIIAGLLSSWWLGTRTLMRVLREGSRARQGLFLFSGATLWYGCMCIGGLFFHCLHVRTLPHILDVVGTGLCSLSVSGGFAAFTGKLDDRTPQQRLGFGLASLAFVALVILSPPLVLEILYVVPALLATGTGFGFVLKSSSGSKPHREAQRWLLLAALGIALTVGMMSMDKYTCVFLGANFSLVFWLFLGCNVTILSSHQFALVVADNNLHFTDVKTQ